MVATRTVQTENRVWMAECASWTLVMVGIVLAILAGQETAAIFTSSAAWVPTEATVVRTGIGETSKRSLVIRTSAPVEFLVTQELVYFRKGSRYQERVALGTFATEREAREEVARAAKPGSSRTIWVSAANPASLRLHLDDESAVGWKKGFLAVFGLASAATGSEASNAPQAAPQPDSSSAYPEFSPGM